MEKNEKEKFSPLPVKHPAGVPVTEYFPIHPSFSTQAHVWLQSVVGEDEHAVSRQYRNLHAEIFLQSVLYPLLEREIEIDEDLLVLLMVNYKTSIVGLGSDFEISGVIGSIMNHFQCASIADEPPSMAELPAGLMKDLTLFTLLSALDLEEIDFRVTHTLVSR